MNIQSLVLSVLMGLFIGSNLMAVPSYPPRVGDPHPNFVLPKIENRQPVSLSQFRGKKVLLINFASW